MEIVPAPDRTEKRLLIQWKRTDTWRTALTEQDAMQEFGTTDPVRIALAIQDNPGGTLSEWEECDATGNGEWSDLSVVAASAGEEDEGVFWLYPTPEERQGPFPSTEAAYEYWQEELI